METGEITVQQAIVKFCEAKRDYLKERLPASTPLYVNDDDIKEILSLTDEQANKIWRKMYRYLKKNRLRLHILPSLRPILCPWCIIYMDEAGMQDCNSCGYGDRHGICDVKDDSDFRVLYLKVRNQFTGDECNAFYVNTRETFLSLHERIKKSNESKVGG